MTQPATPHPLIASFEGEIKQIVSIWYQFDVALNQIRDPNGVGLDRSAVLHWGGTLDEFGSQFLSLLLILEAVSQAKSTTLIPIDASQNLPEKLQNLRVHLEGMLQTLNQSIEGGVIQVMPSSVSFTLINGSSIDFNQNFTNLFQVISGLSVLLFPIAEAVKLEFNMGNSIDRLRENLKELAEILAESRRTASDITAAYKVAESESKATADLKNQIEADKIEAQRSKNECSDDRDSTAGYKSEASTNLAEIKQIAENAANLSSQVTAYSAQFSTFQASLDERDQRYAKQSTKVDTIIEKNEINASEIERLTRDANAMLTGATVAGLASAYSKIRKELTRQLFMARWSFFVGIAFLTVSLLPLALYVFPYLFAWLPIPEHLAQPTSPSSDIKFEIYALQILARLAMLLPAAWFLRFAANRHASLFRLREEYSHRYSLASSVEGFKKQADEFKEHIAAATYANISINPATALDNSKKSTDGDPPNPFMRRFLDVFTRDLGTSEKKN
jgi:hypothetical protein